MEKLHSFNFNGYDNVLFILAQEPSHLGGVERVRDKKWYFYNFKSVEELSKSEIIDIKNRIEKEADASWHKKITEFSKSHKGQVHVYDLSPYNLGKIHNLKNYYSAHTLQDLIDRKEGEKDIPFQLYRQDSFSNLVNLMNMCEHLVYIGEASKGIDFSNLIDEFSTIQIISEDIVYDKNIIDKIPEESFNHIKIYDTFSFENLDKVFNFLENKISKFKFDVNQPYIRDFDMMIDKWNDFIKENNLERDSVISKESVRKLLELYPFLKNFPPIVVETMWNTYCIDTTRGSMASNPKKVTFEFFFIEMFLFYSLTQWSKDSNNNFIINRPKINFLRAYNEANYRDINRFKNLIKKNRIEDFGTTFVTTQEEGEILLNKDMNRELNRVIKSSDFARQLITKDFKRFTIPKH